MTFLKKPVSGARVYRDTKRLLLYAVMILLVLFTALPLIYLVSTAFKPLHELFAFPPKFLVRQPTLQNFADLFLSLSSSAVPFSRYIFNSTIITVFTVVGTIFVSTLGAFSLVKYNPPGAKKLFDIVIAALMFPTAVTTIPRYLVITGLGLDGSYLALILPSLAVSFNFFLIKQFVEQFPNDLLEAARIDGANESRVYWSIVMPSLRPAWATLLVMTFTNTWNDYFSPMIYLNSQELKTLPLALQSIGSGIGRAGAVSAATLLMTVPTVIVFTMSQRKMLNTMMHAGIKG